MPREAPLRFSVTELQWDDAFMARVASTADITEGAVRALVDQANDRLTLELRLKQPPLQVTRASLRANDVVGLLRLSPRIEFEIAPKYLGADEQTWREDFLLIANLSRFGRLLSQDRMASGLTGVNALVNLIGQAIVEMYWDNYRRPLRTYRTRRIHDFDLVGEADPEDLILPNPDGFAQRVTSFTSGNPFNGVILEATTRLLTEVDDAETRRQLVRVAEHLSPQQPVVGRRPTQVPSRHRRWQPLYDLACQVIDGFGLDLSAGHLTVAPGFVLRAAKSWEDLVTRASRLGLPDARVVPQDPHPLGTRNGKLFKATPDLSVYQGGGRILADAKYIGRADQDGLSVDAGDVYEGLAFLRAAECERLVLLYPRRHREGLEAQPVGTATLFEHIEVGGFNIYAYEIEVKGISAKGGFRQFAISIGDTVRSHFPVSANA